MQAVKSTENEKKKFLNCARYWNWKQTNNQRSSLQSARNGWKLTKWILKKYQNSLEKNSPNYETLQLAVWKNGLKYLANVWAVWLFIELVEKAKKNIEKIIRFVMIASPFQSICDQKRSYHGSETPQNQARRGRSQGRILQCVLSKKNHCRQNRS